MASSRWKRFAFFEKNALSLPSEVLEDLIPVGEGTSSGSRSSRRSGNSSSEETSSDRVNLVVTTGALPLESKPSAAQLGSIGSIGGNNNAFKDDHDIALNDMWGSVTACNPMESLDAAGYPGIPNVATNLHLPSQAQAFQDDSNVVSSGSAIDGLVLAFVTSRDTNRVHCFDISVRCNNKNKESSKDGKAKISKSGKKNGDLEDLDGWRGYLAPMKGKQQDILTNDVGEPTGGAVSSGTSEKAEEGIVGIATCRTTSGHKPIHMACITASNLVVCIDPHLHLSWYVSSLLHCYSIL